MILGVVGHMGAGKDVVAERLVTRYGFTRVAFADALKDEVATRLRRTVLRILEADKVWWQRLCRYASQQGLAIDEPLKLLFGLWIDKPPTIRALLQEYGTEVRRADRRYYWETAWTERVTARFGLPPQTWPPIVVPDVRFPGEAAWLRMHVGTWMILVERPGYVGDAHASETQVSTIPVDATLINAGDLDDLANLVDLIAERLQLAPLQERKEKES